MYRLILVCSICVALWPMIKYREKHPVNLLLLCLVTFCCSLCIGILTSVFIPIGIGAFSYPRFGLVEFDVFVCSGTMVVFLIQDQVTISLQ